MTTIEEFKKWLSEKENTHLEFKLAENNFDLSHKLPDYCAAIANEEGGKLILGIEDKTRNIIGTKAFLENWNTLSHKVLQKIGIRVDVEEFFCESKRILIFNIPKHFSGQPVMSNRVYWMRAGESLVPMDKQTLQKIFAEIGPDFSAQIIADLKISDLDDDAILSLRNILKKKGKNKLLKLNDKQLLHALELIRENKVTFACLILLGKKEKIDEILPTSEIIFEWRQDTVKIPHAYRTEWREPFLKVYDEIWTTISNRNIRIPIQEGLIQTEILAFNEQVIREALLNAVTHRDYSIISQSVFIKADPKNLIVISPGGFLPGINPENVIQKQASRNRRIAEVFQKLGLVERSGQGMDQIFESTIREGKGLPNLSDSDDFQVILKIPAQVTDKNFILFLEKVSQEKQIIFSFDEIYELELLRERKVIGNLENKIKFLELDVIEKVGRTSGVKYILSHRYYKDEKKTGTYTKIRGISRDHKKELILDHIRREGQGVKRDFIDAFPELKISDISNLLQELKLEGKIERKGSDRMGYWRTKEKLK